jgi:hypothetical protein
LTESLVLRKGFIWKPSKNGFARYQVGAGVGVLLQRQNLYYFNFEAFTDVKIIY